MSKKSIKIDIKRINARELRKVLFKLPVIETKATPKNDQMIDGWEEGNYYRITKETTPKFPDIAVYILRVSGSSENNRQDLIAQFIEKLGQPFNEFKIPGSPNIDYVYWDAKKVDEED